MDKEREFCEQHCGTLTPNQIVMLNHNLKLDKFLGVGRPLGGAGLMPLVQIGKQANVIDKSGYYQLAAFEGRRGYVSETESSHV
jgi:hypothetical protein